MGIIVTMLGLGFGLAKTDAASIGKLYEFIFGPPGGAAGPKIFFSSLLLIAYFVVYLHQMFLTREYTFSRLITLQKRCHVHRHLCTKIEKTHQTRTKNRTTKNTMIAFSWFCFYKMFCTIDNYYPKSKVICKKSTLFWLCSEKFFKERKFFFRTRGSGRQS